MLLKLILLSFISIYAIFCDSENDAKACKKRKRLEKMLAMAEQDQNSDSSHPLMSKYDEFVEMNQEEISIFNLVKPCHSKKLANRLVNIFQT